MSANETFDDPTAVNVQSSPPMCTATKWPECSNPWRPRIRCQRRIAAYAATGEPQRVAGGFTIDGRGAAFVTSIVGDPYNVIGLSLPLVRQMVIDLGVPWQSLWVTSGPSQPS